MKDGVAKQVCSVLGGCRSKIDHLLEARRERMVVSAGSEAPIFFALTGTRLPSCGPLSVTRHAAWLDGGLRRLSGDHDGRSPGYRVIEGAA